MTQKLQPSTILEDYKSVMNKKDKCINQEICLCLQNL